MRNIKFASELTIVTKKRKSVWEHISDNKLPQWKSIRFRQRISGDSTGFDEDDKLIRDIFAIICYLKTVQRVDTAYNYIFFGRRRTKLMTFSRNNLVDIPTIHIWNKFMFTVRYQDTIFNTNDLFLAFSVWIIMCTQTERQVFTDRTVKSMESLITQVREMEETPE